MCTNTTRKRWLVGALAAMGMAVVLTVGALIQVHHQKVRVAEQRGLTRHTAQDLRALAAPDGLFNLPELGEMNTPESRIDATFMVSLMARDSSYRMATAATNESLYAYARDDRNSLSSRLKAYVALRSFDDHRWEEWHSLAPSIDAAFPPSVSDGDVASYIDIAEPAALLDDNFRPRTRLVPFDATANEQSERLAVSAIALRHLFANSAEINGFFTHLEPTLCQWASGNATYSQQTLFAANALIGTDNYTCINNRYIESLYGCKDSSQLLSVDGKASSDCSLALTFFTYRLGITK